MPDLETVTRTEADKIVSRSNCLLLAAGVVFGFGGAIAEAVTVYMITASEQGIDHLRFPALMSACVVFGGLTFLYVQSKNGKDYDGNPAAHMKAHYGKTLIE